MHIEQKKLLQFSLAFLFMYLLITIIVNIIQVEQKSKISQINDQVIMNDLDVLDSKNEYVLIGTSHVKKGFDVSELKNIGLISLNAMPPNKLEWILMSIFDTPLYTNLIIDSAIFYVEPYGKKFHVDSSGENQPNKYLKIFTDTNSGKLLLDNMIGSLYNFIVKLILIENETEKIPRYNSIFDSFYKFYPGLDGYTQFQKNAVIDFYDKNLDNFINFVENNCIKYKKNIIIVDYPVILPSKYWKDFLSQKKIMDVKTQMKLDGLELNCSLKKLSLFQEMSIALKHDTKEHKFFTDHNHFKPEYGDLILKKLFSTYTVNK